MRRLVRSRVFNNARTATRNLDLPLAIGDPIATQLSPSMCAGHFENSYCGLFGTGQKEDAKEACCTD